MRLYLVECLLLRVCCLVVWLELDSAWLVRACYAHVQALLSMVPSPPRTVYIFTFIQHFIQDFLAKVEGSGHEFPKTCLTKFLMGSGPPTTPLMDALMCVHNCCVLISSVEWGKVCIERLWSLLFIAAAYRDVDRTARVICTVCTEVDCISAAKRGHLIVKNYINFQVKIVSVLVKMIAPLSSCLPLYTAVFFKWSEPHGL